MKEKAPYLVYRYSSNKDLPHVPPFLSSVLVRVSHQRKKTILRAWFEYIFDYLLPRVRSFTDYTRSPVPCFFMVDYVLDDTDYTRTELRYLTAVAFFSAYGERTVTNKKIFRYVRPTKDYFRILFHDGLLERHAFYGGKNSVKQHISITNKGLMYINTLQNKAQDALFKAMEDDFESHVIKNPVQH